MREADALAIGRSSLGWTGDALDLRIDEVTAPIPARIRGRVRLEPITVATQVFDLDEGGRHRWWPIAPCARVEVRLEAPALSWSGHAYLDTNDGDEPLEAGFSHWHWSRAVLPGGTAVLYDVARRSGQEASLALRFDRHGEIVDEDLPARACLPRSLWRVARETRADQGCDPRVLRTLEDGPFYARSVLASRLFGEPVTAIHESLSLDRFRKPIVQAMLPFRMPRALR